MRWTQSTNRDLAGIHVLVVEDTDDSRELLRIALEYRGALVMTAASVEEARRILSTLRPHVIVTDIAMPDAGLALIRETIRIARATGRPNIPAIAITAHRDRRDELLDAGFAELVEKPLNPIAVCAVVRRHARGRTGMETQSSSNPVCSVCLKPIPPGAGRIRTGLTAIHLECEKRGRPRPGSSADAE